MSAAAALSALQQRGWSVATCESLTGGLVAAALTSVAGSSSSVAGGLVTYSAALKVSLAGVDPDVIARESVVSEAVAQQMAQGVRTRAGVHVGLSCTGVAGPGPQDGKAPGTVWTAVASPLGMSSELLALPGDRQQVREATVEALLTLLIDHLR